MSDRSKYSLNGVYRCENFAQYVENDGFPEIQIGRASDLDGWYIKFRVSIENGVIWVFPFIHHHMNPNIRIRVDYKILKKDGSSAFECQSSNLCLNADQGCTGKFMNIEDLLDEKYGFWYDGALTVEYGLQVNSEQEENGIWKFNFHDKFFGWKTKDYMFEFRIEYRDPVFSHKQIIKLHSTTIEANGNSALVPYVLSIRELLMCLQIAHGVRIQMTAKELKIVIEIAFHLGFFNVVKYCERQLIELDEQPKALAGSLKLAASFNMRCYLVHLLENIESPELLIKILMWFDLGKLSSQSVKAIVAKLFS